MVIYVWLNHIKKMQIYKTIEEYNNSFAYARIIDGAKESELIVYREENTEIWNKR